jgi:DNA invertase Pin-like site-specific DNA recombinase
MEVIIAARLSQKHAGRGQSGIESQDEDAREWAEGQGHNVIATVADHASGTKAMWERPNLGQWVTDFALMDRYQGIVAAKQDRLSRADWRDEAELRMWAENNGKTLFIVDRELRWPPREGAHHEDDVSSWNDGAEAAHREWANDSRRYKRMQKQRRSNNELTGRAPYGYRITGILCGQTPCRCSERKIDDHKTLTIYEPEAEIVREAVRRYLDGETLKQIADDLNTRGGRKWHVSTLAKMLHSPSIAGRRMDNYEGRDKTRERKTILRYQGIIEWTEHEQLVARLDSRAHRKGISPQNVFLLTGLIFDVSGHPMYGQKFNAKTPWFYYYCRQCANGGMRVDDADAEANDLITFVYGKEPHEVRRVIPGNNYFEQIARLRQDRAELDDLSPEYEDRHAALTAEIRRLAVLPAEPDSVEWVPSDVTVAEHWRTLDTGGRRDWLKERHYIFIAYKAGSLWNLSMQRVGKDYSRDAITAHVQTWAATR